MSTPRHDNTTVWADHIHNLKNYVPALSIDVILDKIKPIATDAITNELMACKTIMQELTERYSKEMLAIKDNHPIDPQATLTESTKQLKELYERLGNALHLLSEQKSEPTLLATLIAQLKRDGHQTLDAMSKLLNVDYSNVFTKNIQLPESKLTLESALSEQIRLNAIGGIKIDLQYASPEIEKEFKTQDIQNEQQLKIIRSIAQNCLGNAKRFLLKSNTENPTIQITVKKENDQYAIAFQDNGPGISSEILTSLNQGGTASKDGHGFGISGTRAHFYKDFAAGESKPSMKASNLESGGAMLEWQFPIAALHKKPSVAPKQTGLNILYVEDNTLNRNIFEKKINDIVQACFKDYQDNIHFVMIDNMDAGREYLNAYVDLNKESKQSSQSPHLLAVIDLTIKDQNDGYQLLDIPIAHKIRPDQAHLYSFSAGHLEKGKYIASETVAGVTEMNKPLKPILLGEAIKQGLQATYPDNESLKKIDVAAILATPVKKITPKLKTQTPIKTEESASHHSARLFSPPPKEEPVTSKDTTPASPTSETDVKPPTIR